MLRITKYTTIMDCHSYLIVMQEKTKNSYRLSQTSVFSLVPSKKTPNSHNLFLSISQ